MSHHDLVVFLLQMAVMLAAAIGLGQAMRRVHLPAVIGELLGGILLGPTVFGALAAGWQASLFPTTGAASLGREAAAKLGLLLFLFIAGAEVHLEHFNRRRWSIVWTSALGIAVPFVLGCGIVLFYPRLWGTPAESNVVLFALFIGTALSISALPVIARILMDLDLLTKEVGVVVMAAAIINDLIGWSLFAVILSYFGTGSASNRNGLAILGAVLGLFGFILIAGRAAGQRVLHWAESRLAAPGDVIGVTIILVLIAGAATEAVGVHASLGAFLVGIALAPAFAQRDKTRELIRQFACSFLAPIYFVSIGLRADFAANFDFGLVAVVILVACIGKIAGAGLGAWMGKMPPREALAVGFGMNARGAIEMILATVALEYRLIDERIFVALIIMALVTSLLSGPVMQWLLTPQRTLRHKPGV